MLVATDTFGKRLRALRAEKGLNQSQLARLAGYSRQHVHQLENGESQPTWETVLKLARALGVSVAAFDVEEEPVVPEPPPPPPRRFKKK